MPITFQTPPIGGQFGPGYQITVQSDFIGPLPTGSYWVALVQPIGDELFAYASSASATTAGPLSWTFRLGDRDTSGFQVAIPQLVPGGNVNLRVELRSPTSTIDTGVRQVVWEPTAGLGFVLERALAGQFGISPTLQAQIEETHQATRMAFPGLPTQPLNTLMQFPAPNLLAREQVFPDRTGRGELTRPGGLFQVNAFGIHFDVLEVPQHIGVQLGAPDEYSRPILSLEVVSALRTGAHFISQYHDFTVGAQHVYFNPLGVVRLGYYIPPDVVIRFFWLIA